MSNDGSKDRSDYFAYKPNDIHFSACTFCKHDQGDGVCVAFPDGVPNDIQLAKNMHQTAIEGDGGVVFELRDGYTLPKYMIDNGGDKKTKARAKGAW